MRERERERDIDGTELSFCYNRVNECFTLSYCNAMQETKLL